MTIRDRGTMKWTAIMLPEHVAMLREYYADQKKKEKPELDEQEIEEIERMIFDGMEGDLKLVLIYWSDGNFKTLIGKVDCIDQISKKIKVVDEFNDKFYLDVENVVSVQIG
ncbi:YolD-like family protein [Anaerobacillus isosaccharinicus]|uniref:YolD-like family protein n=1 Tax=Anaerobacillus isosaccharinicus TaxID=1532552 RepID=A0A1S2LP36_9BACI|nr:YolD-like family protein [Anaerobacillus isosaccharinicus]MBA5587575.1 YolD-like family protein [Anaerobacillus isosaccharinicus]QOY34248.1 YolD-like family protein [Anaerobacillus isosaccharinicus]